MWYADLDYSNHSISSPTKYVYLLLKHFFKV